MKKTSMENHTRHINKKEKAYTLIGVLLITSLFCISFLIYNKVWITVDLREREKELKFNMTALQRGINLYKKENGTYPDDFDILFDSGLIRKKYQNPFRQDSDQSWLYNPESGTIKPNSKRISLDGSKYENWRVEIKNNRYDLKKH